MIVIDASIVAPMVLDDEPPLPDAIAARLLAGPLTAPAHWPLEVGNILHVAERRRRIDRRSRDMALAYVRDLGVTIATGDDGRAWDNLSGLADAFTLTIYDAAYLDLAMRQRCALATLDAALVAAASRNAVELITY